MLPIRYNQKTFEISHSKNPIDHLKELCFLSISDKSDLIPMTREEALQKLEQYCDYQDRCHQEVRTRLLNYKLTGDDLEWVIGALIHSGHLNEERFARSLVRGKFRIKGWGRIRLEQELQRRNIGEYIRRKAMTEVDETEYLLMLRQVLDRAMRKVPLDFTDHQKKDYLIKYGQRKGYEWEYIQRLLPEVLASDMD